MSHNVQVTIYSSLIDKQQRNPGMCISVFSIEPTKSKILKIFITFFFIKKKKKEKRKKKKKKKRKKKERKI